MATRESRIARMEAQMAPEVAPDVRDPALVDLVRMFDKECPIERIPCGVSGRRLLEELIQAAQGTSLPVVSE